MLQAGAFARPIGDSRFQILARGRMWREFPAGARLFPGLFPAYSRLFLGSFPPFSRHKMVNFPPVGVFGGSFLLFGEWGFGKGTVRTEATGGTGVPGSFRARGLDGCCLLSWLGAGWGKASGSGRPALRVLRGIRGPVYSGDELRAISRIAFGNVVRRLFGWRWSKQRENGSHNEYKVNSALMEKLKSRKTLGWFEERMEGPVIGREEAHDVGPSFFEPFRGQQIGGGCNRFAARQAWTDWEFPILQIATARKEILLAGGRGIA